jgi:polar amino acid transport system substrate-binding protein
MAYGYDRHVRCGLGALLLALGGLLAQPAWSQAVPVVEQARAALPAAMRDSGVLKVATSLQWPPFDYQGENGKPDGIDIRLVGLLAAKLGLRAEFSDIKFPSIVPGVATGRYDIGVDQISITPERLKAVSFLPYYQSAYGLLVREGVTGIDVNHLCGRTLVLTQGSAQVTDAQTLSGQCVKSGQAPIAFLFYPSSAETYLALANGRGDGFMTDRAVGVYIAQGNNKGNSKLTMTASSLPGMINTAGIVIGRDNGELREALRLALESAIADGGYQKIMSDFGVPEGALTVEQVRHPPLQ